jgi:hypothetical protein
MMSDPICLKGIRIFFPHNFFFIKRTSVDRRELRNRLELSNDFDAIREHSFLSFCVVSYSERNFHVSPTK